MRQSRLLALRRKRETAVRAGMTHKLELLDAWIAAYEAEIESAAGEPVIVHVDIGPLDPLGVVGEQETEAEPEAQAPAGVALTPAAQALADELGVTPEDLKQHQPSGKDGFLKSDIKRIAEAKAHIEEDSDGDD